MTTEQIENERKLGTTGLFWNHDTGRYVELTKTEFDLGAECLRANKMEIALKGIRAVLVMRGAIANPNSFQNTIDLIDIALK